MKKAIDTTWATVGEGGLILILAVIAWVAGQPLIFASLGPTAYEVVEQPQLRSARIYNVIVGHFVGLGSGFLALYLFNAWAQPNIMSHLTLTRVWAAVVAAVLTTLVNLILRSSQPAALATTLLVSLGAMQTRRAAISIIVGVLILALIGEPVRRIRLKYAQKQTA